MEKFKIKGEFIHLNQLIKAVSWVSNGAEANNLIESGLIKVNNQPEYRKRNKLRVGDVVEYQTSTIIVE
ncbi:MAG: RNA-binding S4 domain-containing protein [Bacteroidia bacterium]